jgi:hypothetical protein
MGESVIQETIPSPEEKARALELVKNRLCPHCNRRIKLAHAVSMLFGAGWDQTVFVQLADGSEVALRATQINPQTMRVIEPE